MAAGFVIGGTVAGITAAAATLADGHSLLLALAAWVVVGTLTALALGGVAFVRASARGDAGAAPLRAAHRTPAPEGESRTRSAEAVKG